MECKEEITAEDSAMQLAIEKVKSEFKDEDFLEDLADDGIVADEDEVSLIKVYSDFEDVTVEDSDFEDEHYEFVIKAKIKDEEADVYKYLNVSVEVDNNEAEITSVEE
jgi:hypothetical protein